jgi:hypothetical protein
MTKRNFTLFFAIIIVALSTLPVAAFAQSNAIEWTRWDAAIEVQQNGTLKINEVQRIRVLSGSVGALTRFWAQPVTVDGVKVLYSGQIAAKSLRNSSSGDPDTYAVTSSGGQTSVRYVLTERQGANSAFDVQIDYRTTRTSTTAVNWVVIPEERPGDVLNSKVVLNFVGSAPDPAQISVTAGNARVSTSNGSIVLDSRGSIPANSTFAIDIPIRAAGSSNVAATPASSSAGSGSPGSVPQQDLLSGLGCNSTTLLLIGAAIVLFMVMSRRGGQRGAARSGQPGGGGIGIPGLGGGSGGSGGGLGWLWSIISLLLGGLGGRGGRGGGGGFPGLGGGSGGSGGGLGGIFGDPDQGDPGSPSRGGRPPRSGTGTPSEAPANQDPYGKLRGDRGKTPTKPERKDRDNDGGGGVRIE